jgi:DNA-binding CsgD family transcriptional regulator
MQTIANGGNVAALSRRERVVAAKFAEGRTYKEIAQQLCISPGTVRTHLTTIYRKLGVSNKVMLVELMAPHARTIDLRRPWSAHEVPARDGSQQAVQVSPQDKGYLAEDGVQLALSSTCAGCMPVEDWRSGAAQGRRMSQTLLEIKHLIPSAKLPVGIGSSLDSDELGDLLRALDALLVRFGSVVTQRREALDRLAASEAGYRAGLIARITPDGRLSFVNDAYCCYYGRRRGEILGHTYNEFTLTISEDRERFDDGCNIVG